MSGAVNHSGAGPLSLMSCVRESSPPHDGIHEYEIEKNVSSKKKFWNPRKWFRRKHNKVSEEATPPKEANEQTLRSRSTSELSVEEEQIKRRSGTPLHPGLSVSHDSVFQSPHSGSELDLDGGQSSSSLSISHHHHQPTLPDIRLQTELKDRLVSRRARGDTSEDDEGLPHSPCNSPTTTDGLLDKTNIKDHHQTKSHSTCSDGSLLSMGSSEMDEDSFGQHSRHSSKLSLHEKRTHDFMSDSEFEWGPSNSSAPLNHSAAHHKVAVRPKRTHGAPRRKRPNTALLSALPTTPEVNEDSSIRSISPDTTIRETLTELYTSMSKTQTQIITDTKLKCSSLPPGLAGPGGKDGSKLSRSRSNAGSKSQDPFTTTLEEEEQDADDKKESSFFGRIFQRKSAKKHKKIKEEVVVNSAYLSSSNNSFYSSVNYVTLDPLDRRTDSIDSNLAIRPNALIRTGPASRQRMQPIDIPASPDLFRRDDIIDKSTSPLQLELENRFKNRMTMPVPIPTSSSQTHIHYDASPIQQQPLHFAMSSPPKSPHYTKKYKFEENKTKRIPPALSSLQQRVLSHNDDDDIDNSFKSLTNIPTDYERISKPVVKTQSFKSTKTNFNAKEHTKFTPNEAQTNKEKHLFKSASLDSVQNLEANIVESINSSKINVTVNKIDDNIKAPEGGFTPITETFLNQRSSKFVNAEDEINWRKSTLLNANSEIINQRSKFSETFINSEDVLASEVINRRSKFSETFLNSEDVLSTELMNRRKSDAKETLENEVILRKHVLETELINKETIINAEIERKTKTTETLIHLCVDVKPDVIEKDEITISGPSHKAIVNINSTQSLIQKEQQISVTKIQVNNKLPAFFNVQLKKGAELNVKLLNAPKTPTAVEEVFNFDESDFKSDARRKFSNDNIELIKKDEIFQSNNNGCYKKHSIISISPEKDKRMLRIKSNSLDSCDSKSGEISPNSNKSSQNSLDKQETKSQENLSTDVIMRRKSANKTMDDEPELLKVFARRSIKLKDTDSEIISQQVKSMVEENDTNKSRDSDKENVSDSSPIERKKAMIIKDKKDLIIPPKKPQILQSNLKELLQRKENLFLPPKPKDLSPKQSPEVLLRKPTINNKFIYPRTTSLIPPQKNNIELKLQKQNSIERPKTENWFNKSQEDNTVEVEKVTEEIITNISEKKEIITEINNKPKNFNQRKAEWEKRAQEGLRKTVP